MSVRALLKDMLWPFLLFLLLFLVWNGVEAASPARMKDKERIQSSRTNDINNVLLTLEARIRDREVLDKAKVKICGLPAGRLSLMSSLCDRISADESAVGADIAYSLISALIVLS